MKLRFDKNPDPIPAGKYKSKIEASEFRESSAGNTYLYLRHIISEGAYKGRGISATIIFRSQKTWLQKKGQTRWVQLLNALGWKKCGSEDLLVGQEVTIELTNKDRNGSPYTEVKNFVLPQTAKEIVEEAASNKNKSGVDTW
jgi:hypothetical protein